MKNILVVNDDGYNACGLIKLAEALSKRNKVTVVAPYSQKSGMGHAITFGRHIKAEWHNIIENVEIISFDGTPCDCVLFGLLEIMKTPPDCVISGINHGYNLGDDIIYSGTVNAAVESAINNIKAIAVSMSDDQEDFDFPASFISNNLDRLLEITGEDNDIILNINFPYSEKSKTKGVKFAKLGKYTFENWYDYDPMLGYVLKGKVRSLPNENIETDVEFAENGFITITPVKPRYSDINLFNKKVESFKEDGWI